MIEYIRRKLLKWHKSIVLTEVRADMAFIRDYKGHRLSYDETDARMQLANITRSDLPDEEKAARKQPIEDDIYDAMAVKKEYEKLIKMEADLTQYIAML